ncbi:MAG: phosphate ABC transporter permease subunit PstC [Rhodobacteraceae bacterium]|nr:phosphate ABC transporter permease subunit PstC [Paracoccaceae bacterium]
MTIAAFVLLLAMVASAYVLNFRAAAAIRAGGTKLHSVAFYHGSFAALTVALPVFCMLIFWLLLQRPVVNFITMNGLPAEILAGLGTGERQLLLAEIQSVASGRIFGEPGAEIISAGERMNSLNRTAGLLMLPAVLAISVILAAVSRRTVGAGFRARPATEKITLSVMLFCAFVAVFTTVGIIASLLVESIHFFSLVPLTEFLFGMNWEPQIPMREDQVAAEGAFGWIPVLVGTLLIMLVALAVAVPVGLLSAIYLHEFAAARIRAVAKPVLEILAGVPTVVYGFFAILVIAPALRSFGTALGLDIAPNTALAAGGVMGIMLIPFISSFADDALGAVPRQLRDGALALGATRAETMLQVLFPAALPGIAGGILLAVSRAIGETMIVVMAAGLIAKLTFNPLDSVTTVTVQIMTLLIGDTSFDNPKTLAAFALGLMLFLVTLCINVAALRIVRKYREVYE